jgi:hypothetical protein
MIRSASECASLLAFNAVKIRKSDDAAAKFIRRGINWLFKDP